jgi:hypothetical protein
LLTDINATTIPVNGANTRFTSTQETLNTNISAIFREKIDNLGVLQFNKKLHWLDKNTTDVVSDLPGVVQGSQIDNINVMNNQQISRSTDVPNELAQILHALSRLRFDTTFIRNLIFITNLYRSVRMKLARDLNYSKEVITRSIPITQSSITEFYDNDVDQQRTVQYDQQMMNRYRF